jgi:hypothetical protein
MNDHYCGLGDVMQVVAPTTTVATGGFCFESYLFPWIGQKQTTTISGQATGVTSCQSVIGSGLGLGSTAMLYARVAATGLLAWWLLSVFKGGHK